jgi:hypothetical protein
MWGWYHREVWKRNNLDDVRELYWRFQKKFVLVASVTIRAGR